MPVNGGIDTPTTCEPPNRSKKNAIIRFQKREALAFVSGSKWPHPVHGWVPFVEDLPTEAIPLTDVSSMITRWHSLTDIPLENVVIATIAL